MSLREKRLQKKLQSAPSDIIVFDLETTGVNPSFAEILQIGICDGNGRVLYSSYVKPHRKSWKAAEKVNHISPKMVADAPTFSEIRPEIQRIFNEAKVVAGYNCIRYDIPILERYGIVVPLRRYDVMSEFHSMYPLERYRLIDCASFCGVSLSAHDAVNDARATSECMQYLLLRPKFRRRKSKAVNPREEYSVGEFEFVSDDSPQSNQFLRGLFRKHKRRPFIWGLILIAVGLGFLYYKMGGSFRSMNTSFLNPTMLVAAAKTDRLSLIISALIPIGVILAVVGLFNTVKKAILRIINFFRKIFTEFF